MAAPRVPVPFPSPSLTHPSFLPTHLTYNCIPNDLKSRLPSLLHSSSSSYSLSRPPPRRVAKNEALTSEVRILTRRVLTRGFELSIRGSNLPCQDPRQDATPHNALIVTGMDV
ncbi:hypothetical protein E2C01_049487 [Portunus trituberculatus]|uniref:Uncharacterized protein n=1 Tax=Portunus trituberculatus TaxID=210409 RepID=A0A5B7GE08_PORTR|nr:hypothetical protein [Portunus trituberculatus]